MRLAAMAFLCCACSISAQPRQYDLLLKGGHVIDAKNHRNDVFDVAIANGKIARVAKTIPANSAGRTVDCKGLYVTPGLVDIHVHVYAVPGLDPEGLGNICVLPDSFSFRSGVTTMVDAGTSGWRNFPDFKQKIIDTARTRVLAWLNIVAHGMETPAYQQDVREMDSAAAAECARKYPEIIVGFKTAHFAGPEWAALDGAIAAGKLTNLPVMVDYGPGHPQRPFSEALRHMRPGDIYTHFYGRPRPLLDDHGQPRPEFAEARQRGVLFDVGHGAGSFLWRQAVPAIHVGFVPDSVSTDLHSGASNAGMKDILNVLSKLLAIGMPLEDLIAKATWTPAREIHHEELGNLTEGGVADVAVLRLRTGAFGFVDVNGARMNGTRKLEAELTVRAGKVVWDLNGITRDDWRSLNPNYGYQGDDSWDGTLMGRPKKP
jgi:dihydroorotase